MGARWPPEPGWAPWIFRGWKGGATGKPGERVMNYPLYCIIFSDRAVTAARTPDGGLAFAAYSPAKDEFEPVTGEFVFQALFGEETDYVSEEEFEAFVARQRAEAKSKREGEGGPEH
jgi:hypothetical protein